MWNAHQLAHARITNRVNVPLLHVPCEEINLDESRVVAQIVRETAAVKGRWNAVKSDVVDLDVLNLWIEVGCK